jgi:hypothetical protein
VPSATDHAHVGNRDVGANSQALGEQSPVERVAMMSADTDIASRNVARVQTVLAGELANRGFVRLAGPFGTPTDAWRHAETVIASTETDVGDLEVIGNFVVPPSDGPPSRDFQTLHFDFGVPLVPVQPSDVARFTALHIASDASSAGALTRLLPLRALVRGTPWPGRDELLRRFAAYGESHGAWDSSRGYVEGSLARIVEAALGRPPALPSLPNDPDFLCGTEFACLVDEAGFFAQRAIVIEKALIEVQLLPSELLVFDNLALAHGRRGVRQPGELHQRVFGHRALPVAQQIMIRDRVLDAFAA